VVLGQQAYRTAGGTVQWRNFNQAADHGVRPVRRTPFPDQRRTTPTVVGGSAIAGVRRALRADRLYLGLRRRAKQQAPNFLARVQPYGVRIGGQLSLTGRALHPARLRVPHVHGEDPLFLSRRDNQYDARLGSPAFAPKWS
jgi:hypothetical protein